MACAETPAVVLSAFSAALSSSPSAVGNRSAANIYAATLACLLECPCASGPTGRNGDSPPPIG